MAAAAVHARLSILGSTLCIWCCSLARADALTVWIGKFDVCSLAIEISDLCCSWRFGSFSTIPGSLLSLSHPICFVVLAHAEPR